jgi:hypothetical protein
MLRCENKITTGWLMTTMPNPVQVERELRE